MIQDALGLNGEGAREVKTALREATRECAKLVYLKTEDLAETVEHYEAHLAGQEQDFTDDGLVNRLAEYTRGREFLIGSLLMHCFERSA